MIDMHCHILPGIDDGAKTMDHALRMAALAVHQGIDTLIATPHHATRSYSNTAVHIQRGVLKLNEKLLLAGIPLRVLPGQEYHLSESYTTEYKLGRLHTLANSSYLLVELPARKIPVYFAAFAAYMERQHIRIVIAHPERNQVIIRKPELLHGWIKSGILLQVTTHSILGRFGSKIQRTAEYICQQNWAHYVASDAHNTLHRSFYLREAYQRIEEIYGAAYANTLRANAKKLVQQDEVTA